MVEVLNEKTQLQSVEFITSRAVRQDSFVNSIKNGKRREEIRNDSSSSIRTIRITLYHQHNKSTYRSFVIALLVLLDLFGYSCHFRPCVFLPFFLEQPGI